MPLAISIPPALGRFKRLPQRAGKVWQGDIVRFPMWVDNQTDPDGPPFRPSGVLWASLRTGLVHLDLANEGEQARTRAAFDAAIHANPYVVSYLLDPDSIPFDRPPHFALRSRQEAAYVAETLADALAATDGALEWLAAQASRPSGPGRRRRGR